MLIWPLTSKKPWIKIRRQWKCLSDQPIFRGLLSNMNHTIHTSWLAITLYFYIFIELNLTSRITDNQGTNHRRNRQNVYTIPWNNSKPPVSTVLCWWQWWGLGTKLCPRYYLVLIQRNNSQAKKTYQNILILLSSSRKYQKRRREKSLLPVLDKLNMDSNWSQNFSLVLLSPPSPNISPSLLSLTNIFLLPVHFSFHLYSFLLTLVKFCHIMMSPLPFPSHGHFSSSVFHSPDSTLSMSWHLAGMMELLEEKKGGGTEKNPMVEERGGYQHLHKNIFIPTTCRPQSFVSHWPVPSYDLLCTSPLPAHIFVSY